MSRPTSLSAWASARAGMRWPPVPPPARSTLNPTPTQPRSRNAERGTADQGGEPHGKQLADRVPRRPRDAKPEPHERAEQDEQGQHTQESPLLADGREDEIGVGVRQVAEFLLALPEADAEQPSRPDADQRLVHLPGRFGPCAPR